VKLVVRSLHFTLTGSFFHIVRTSKGLKTITVTLAKTSWQLKQQIKINVTLKAKQKKN